MDLPQVLVRVIPIAFLAALSPVNITIVILMLLSENHPIARALSFIAGFLASLLFVGTILIGIISNLKYPELRPQIYFAIAVIGIVLLILGIRQLVAHIDPDASSADWMTRMVEFRPFTAFWVGFLFSTLGLKTISLYFACIGIIASASLGAIDVLLAVALVIVTILSTMLLPVIVFLAQPRRGKEYLGRMRGWLEDEQNRIAGAMLAIVGGALVFTGIQGLI